MDEHFTVTWFQFVDFWLSFMAVVSTFIYMATIGEASKRTIHASAFIVTAVLAVMNATWYVCWTTYFVSRLHFHLQVL